MSPEQLAQFQAKLAQDSGDDYVRGPNAPVVDGGTAPTRFSEALGRVRESGERLASNPAIQGLTAVMNPSAGMLNAATGNALSASGIGQRAGSFTREYEGGPQPVNLQPIASGPEPNVPVSPTLASGYGAPRASAASVGGSMGGVGGFGGLAGAVRQAHANQIGTYDRQKDIVETGGDLRAERIAKEAEMQELAAARMQRDAEVQKEHDQAAMQKHEAFLARNAQLADDIGAQKIEPNKVIGDMSAGTKIGFLIAGALSGAAGQGPQFMQRLNDQVEQGVRAQIANVDNKKAALGARQNLFGQMMAESGDRRIAEAQTRNLIYESVKQDLAAKSARLGIPEVQNNAQAIMADIQATKQDPLLSQIATENLRNQQAAAAAAAAAQRAAEERVFTRSMQVAELGLKVDAQAIERAKLGKGEQDKVESQAQTLGTALADPKLADGRAAVEAAKRRLKDAPADEGLPGVGATADLRKALAARPQGANALNPMAWVTHKVAGLSPNEAVSSNDWESMKMGYQHAVTGAGASLEERAMINKAFEGGKSPAEQRNAVEKADAIFKQVEARHKASVSPEARKLFEDRLNGIDPQLPASVKVNR